MLEICWAIFCKRIPPPHKIKQVFFGEKPKIFMSKPQMIESRRKELLELESMVQNTGIRLFRKACKIEENQAMCSAFN